MRVGEVTIDSKKLGLFLKAKRREKGLSQERAAARIRCCLRTIGKIEQGAHVPSILTFYKMSELYDFSIDDVLSKVCKKW